MRGTAGDLSDQQLETLKKRVAQMERSTACVDAEAQKIIYALETESMQLRNDLTKLSEQTTAPADEKVARPDYCKMTCKTICGRMGPMATTCR